MPNAMNLVHYMYHVKKGQQKDPPEKFLCLADDAPDHVGWVHQQNVIVASRTLLVYLASLQSTLSSVLHLPFVEHIGNW